MKNKEFKIIKKVFIFLLIPIIFFIVTLVNIYYKEKKIFNNVNLYTNEVSKMITNDEYNKITYNMIKNDLIDTENIIIEQINSITDVSKKNEYYVIASNIYNFKINEMRRLLNLLLNDTDFYELEVSIDDFSKNLENAINDINNTNDSTLNKVLNKNKFLYEEKRNKCHDILETYKGFLNE